MKKYISKGLLAVSFMVEMLAVQSVRAQDAVKVAEEPAQKIPLQLGVFVDTYYSSSLYRPVSRDRQFLTQIARDREFNINLAHIEAVVNHSRVRGRLALQYGTSVNANYQYESTTEKYSNQLSARNLQEAYAGYRLVDKLWLDAGIFFGHIGFENWISHNNWNYTRALNLDNVPYYATGARLSYEPTAALTLQLHVLNGWQTITPTNSDKSFGTQVSYEFSKQFKVVHNAFAGNVAPDDTTTQYRFYSNLILQYSPLAALQLALSADVGAQKNAFNNGYRQWYTGAAYIRYLVTPQWSTALRLEYFIDPEQVMIAAASENGFQVGGATANVDFMPEDAYRLRFEYRNFFSKDSIYRFSDGPRPQEHIVSVGASLKM